MTRHLSRRTALTGLLGAGVLAGCGHARQTGSVPPVTATAPQRHTYGSDPSQYGELHLPSGAPTGTVVVIHGGFWRSQYGAELGTSLAADLASRGYAAWNLEYRRVGNGGGWPATLADVAAGIDLLATLPHTDNIVAVGHSAGGHLATWAAGRGALPAGAPGADPKIRLTGVVSQAGVLDLTYAALTGVGGTAVPDLLGGLPDEVPQRYREASPALQVPLAVPVRCVHSRSDTAVPYDQSERYVAAATKAGGDATLTTVTGTHMNLIETASPDWQVVLDLLPKLLDS